MRMLSAAAVVAIAVAGSATGARAEPWCAYYDAYTYTCGFTSMQQCLATVHGAGGECRPDYRAMQERRQPERNQPRRQRRDR